MNSEAGYSGWRMDRKTLDWGQGQECGEAG